MIVAFDRSLPGKMQIVSFVPRHQKKKMMMESGYWHSYLVPHHFFHHFPLLLLLLHHFHQQKMMLDHHLTIHRRQRCRYNDLEGMRQHFQPFVHYHYYHYHHERIVQRSLIHSHLETRTLTVFHRLQGKQSDNII